MADRKYTGQGYFQKSYRAPKPLYDYLWGLTAPIKFKGSPEEVKKKRLKYHRFLAHLYASTVSRATNRDVKFDPNEFVPIYSHLIDKKFRRSFNPDLLDKRGIIDIAPHQTAQGRSRGFRLRPKILKTAHRIGEAANAENRVRLVKGEDLGPVVNLMNGRKVKTPVKSRPVRIKGGDRDTNTPKLIRDAMKSLKPCPFNPKYVDKWMDLLEAKYLREKSRLKQARKEYGRTSPEYKSAKRKYEQARGKYWNDFYCLETIENQIPRVIPIKSSKGTLLQEYEAPYTPQTSGRITEIGGGFQSATQYFKHRFFRHMKGMVFNYDLKNSQAVILLQELQACNEDLKPEKHFDTTWLENYLADPNRKVEIAENIGIPVSLWKECFYAVIMGAEPESEWGAVYKAIEDYFFGDTTEINRIHQNILMEADDLIKVAKKWRNYIYSTDNRRYHYQHGETKYWKNACNKHFTDYGIVKKDGKKTLINTHTKPPVTHPKTINKVKNKLAAFMLQGREACFIHRLTILCTQEGIPVYKNEHDGIITGQTIPTEIVQKAAKEADLPEAIMEIKELCSEERRKEYLIWVKS